MPANYLVLHIDMEFIVGAISTGYGTPHPILVDGDPLMWLYFFNDPNYHRVSFGKGYKKHYMDREYNYYGKFLKNIEDDRQEFSLRHVQYPLVELLEESGMLKIWKEEYAKVTYTTSTEIPTLLSFSSTIGDLAKQRFVDYISKKGFDVQSYTIPLSELAFFRLFEENEVNITAGHSALMLEATNATLHFTKLTYADNYFLRDGDVKSIVGKGIDPRKRAICKFVVGELNSITGILSSKEEREEEIERFELQAGDWLSRLDAMHTNRPLLIKNISFARAPHITRDILVNKNNLESDTGRYLQDIVSEYEAFVSEYAPNGIDFCCFIGNCFLSERIRGKFDSLIGKDNTFFYKTTDIPGIISCYPRIDLKRYADEENRIRERAYLDALKQEQEKQADLLRKHQEEMEKAAEEAERLKKRQKQQSEEFYRQALDLDKIGHYQDAKIAIDKAINLDPSNIEYRKWADYLSEKIKTMQEKIMLYKQYLSAGDKCVEDEQYDVAIEEYKKAKEVGDNAEINAKIIECQYRIQKREEKQKQIKKALHTISILIGRDEFDEALNQIDNVLSIDNDNKEAIQFKKKIIRAKAQINVNKGTDYLENKEYAKALKCFKLAQQADKSFKECEALILQCETQIVAIKKQKEEEKDELINNKDRRLRELRAECKTHIRKGEDYHIVISNFLNDCHALGIKVFDKACEELLNEFIEMQNSVSQKKQKETEPKSVKSQDKGTKSILKSTSSNVNKSAKNPSKAESAKDFNGNVKKEQQSIAQSLFLSLQFKEAAIQFQKEGNEEMFDKCSKLRQIQKKINIRKEELPNSSASRAIKIIKELQDYLSEFEKYKLPTSELIDLINKYNKLINN